MEMALGVFNALMTASAILFSMLRTSVCNSYLRFSIDCAVSLRICSITSFRLSCVSVESDVVIVILELLVERKFLSVSSWKDNRRAACAYEIVGLRVRGGGVEITILHRTSKDLN
jgi:hypothetical protein